MLTDKFQADPGLEQVRDRMQTFQESDDQSPSASASTRLVNTYDILWQIFNEQHLRGGKIAYPLSRADLAHCARVCHPFYEPAVRVLWSSLDGFVPLWHLLAPSDLPYPEQMYNAKGFQRIIEAQLWDNTDCWGRFVRHARYVHGLHVPKSSMYEHEDWTTASMWNKRILHLLLDRNGGAPLLPSLRSLSWSWASVKDAYLPSMFCSSLSVLLIVSGTSYDETDTSFTDVLRRLQERSPRLSTFTLHMLGKADSSLVNQLVQIPSLRKISLEPKIPLQDVHALLTMPNLHRLNANFSAGDASTVSTTSQNIRNLDLCASSPSLTKLFVNLILPRLESLVLDVYDNAPCGPGLPLCTAAIAGAHFDTLRRLHLTFNAPFHRNQLPPSVSLLALLHPFFGQMQKLESFNLRFDGPLKLWANDDVFEEMAQAWPSLQTLRLNFRAWHKDGPMPTPAVLTLFARWCPFLQELVLPHLNYRIDVDRVLYKELHGCHALRRLFIADDLRSMGTAGPDRILPLAEMVSDLFPHLDLSFRAYIKNPGMPWWMVFDCLRT